MEDYKALIIEMYKLRKADTTWRPNLSRPTPNSLKEECETVCRERWSQADAECLRRFFGPCTDAKSSLQAIRQCPTDKFRPILKFLKEDTRRPADKVVEITAWLLDITERPYDPSVDYGQICKKLIESGNQDFREDEERDKEPKMLANQKTHFADAVEDNSGNSVSEPGQVNRRLRILTLLRGLYGNPYFKSISIAVFAFAVLASAGNWIYGWWDTSNQRKSLVGLQRCMYWAGDRFEQVSCDDKFGYDTMVVAFDSVKFYHLRRVTSPDTITLNAIGRLWYIKRNNNYEFFTSEGSYPPDPKFRLKPVTERIIMNEIRSRQESD